MSTEAADCRALLDRVEAGLRITEAEALRLLESASLAELSRAATLVRNRHNDPARVSFVIDRNVNYTDVCNIYCTFCAFYHRPGDARGYVLTREQLERIVRMRRLAEFVERAVGVFLKTARLDVTGALGILAGRAGLGPAEGRKR